MSLKNFEITDILILTLKLPLADSHEKTEVVVKKKSEGNKK